MNQLKIFTRSNENYAFIDGIRAIAVLWVILFHSWLFQFLSMPAYINGIYNYPLLNWVTKGDLGVDLFFVISGFLIGGIIFKEIKNKVHFNFKRFYVRRFLRLTPVYVFTMILNMLILEKTGLGAIGRYWSNFLYINNYIPHSPMAWTWSLAIEEQFYIVVPFLLVFIFPKFRNKIVFFSIFAAITIFLSWYYVYVKMNFVLPFNILFLSKQFRNWFDYYYVVTHLRYIGLLLGVAAAYLTVNKSNEVKEAFEKYTKWMPVFTLIALLLMILISFTPLGEWAPMPDSIFNHLNVHIGKWYEILCRPIFSACVAFIILCCIFSKNIFIKPVNAFLSAKFFYPIAQVSYSAYLFHEMFIIWVIPKIYAYLSPNYSNKEIFITTVLLSILVILVAAVLMYYLIEQPFQKIKNRIQFK